MPTAIVCLSKTISKIVYILDFNMKEIKIESTLYAFNSLNETPKEIQDLMEIAIEARKKAYAPYSKFKVGAAILLENGEIVSGSNQENASYPSGLCAERTAIYYAGAKYLLVEHVDKP